MVDAVREVCAKLQWRLHYAVCVKTHVHVIVSWKPYKDWRDVHDRIKRVIGLKLARHEGTKGRPWLSEGRDAKQVRDRKHFEHLMTSYLPNHRGHTWHERQTGH